MAGKTLQPVHLYCAAIALAGGVVIAGAAVLAGTSPGWLSSPAFWVLSGCVVIGELIPLRIPRRTGDGEVTISTTFAFALLLCAGLLPAIVAQAVASAVQDVIARKPPWRVAFNVGQLAITLAASAVVLHLVRGWGPPLGSRFGGQDALAIMAASLVFFATNMSVVAPAIALHSRMPLVGYLRSDFTFNMSVSAVLLCIAPIVVTTIDFSPVLFPLFFIPTFAIWHGGRQAAHTAYVEYQAMHDSLTDLPNRLHFREAVATELAEAGSPRGAVLLIDLDRFKEINDTLGHHHGDLVLGELGPRLTSAFAEDDL